MQGDSMDQAYTLDVKDTNYEALKAKYAAVKIGYLKDPFVKYIVQEQVRREIIINRGYWTRTYGIQCFQKKFLQKQSQTDTTQRQIINLGCGYDTFVFNLFHDDKSGYAPFKYLEFDLREVVKKKVKFIKNTKELREAFRGENLEFVGSSEIKSENYGLGSCDLTDVDMLHEKLKSFSVDFQKPTFIFCECVLAYIDRESIEFLLAYFRNHFKNIIFVDYEMFNPNDGFGKMMVDNFKSRGVPLYGINFFNSLQDIKTHYTQIGFENLQIFDMNKVSAECLDQEEYGRVMKLEFLDEYEEYWLMQGHYFFSCAKHTDNKDAVEAAPINSFDLRVL